MPGNNQSVTEYHFPHRGRENVGRWMYWLSKCFNSDLGALSQLPFSDFYHKIWSIPYISDDLLLLDPYTEVVARPGLLLTWAATPGLDCKKRAILIGAWCEANNVPWELVAMSERPDKEIHHVFPLVLIGDQWVNADATYSYHQLGAAKPELTYAERLLR